MDLYGLYEYILAVICHVDNKSMYVCVYIGSGSRTTGEATTRGAEVSEAECRDQPLQCRAAQERNGERASESEYSCVQGFHYLT